MFPENAAFICRTCLTEFQVEATEFETIGQKGEFECPACGFTTGKASLQVSRFFKFYPQFIGAINAMAEDGFELVQGDVFKDQAYRGYHLSELILACKKCTIGIEICLSFIHHMPDFADTFCCPFCQTKPKHNQSTRKFFMALKSIHEAPMTDMEFRLPFQWDIFRPLGLDPFDYQIADACCVEEERLNLLQAKYHGHLPRT
ncbi:MAG: hypothetical protein GY710_11995 [Desulfobacteraceae bacterium]|nr:hypothetical protein [Desulfobacteraceae bacterium]